MPALCHLYPLIILISNSVLFAIIFILVAITLVPRTRSIFMRGISYTTLRDSILPPGMECALEEVVTD